ncbi:MAG: adenosylmethionine decarboxylase [Desulfurococcales archaeon]|nr:adenosylmethionine decarboxylase [Desulfurococcales archaeon]
MEVGLARYNEAKVVGRHVYGNLLNCNNREALRSPELLEGIVREAAEIGNMTVLDVKSWKIGEGVSVVAIILESHITIHTWPEYGFATVDVYSCGSHTDPHAAFNYIVEKLQPEKVETGYFDRSLE